MYYEQGVYLTGPVHNGGNVQLTLNDKIGRTYSVERADALTGTWSWSVS